MDVEENLRVIVFVTGEVELLRRVGRGLSRAVVLN